MVFPETNIPIYSYTPYRLETKVIIRGSEISDPFSNPFIRPYEKKRKKEKPGNRIHKPLRMASS